MRPSPSSRRPSARYTRIVGWNLRTISVAMLLVLFVLPFSATLCALTCDQEAHSEGSGHHHEAAAEASQPAAPDAPLIGGPSVHPCDHVVTVQQATTAPERTQIAVSTHVAALVTVAEFAAPLLQMTGASHGAQPGSTPPTSTPLVLRV
jgi:hypothetical protein